jgi:hypothetical protein
VNADRETFTVTVTPLPDSVPAAARIKAWLKRGLRTFKLRAIALGLPQETPGVAPGGALDAEPARGPAGKEVVSQRPAGATEEPRP